MPTGEPGADVIGVSVDQPVERVDLRYLWQMARARSRHDRRGRKTFVAVAVATFGLLMSFAAINAMADVMTDSARDVISGDLSVFAHDYEYSMLDPESDAVRFIGAGDELAAEVRDVPGVTQVRSRITVATGVESATQRTGGLVIGADFVAEGYTAIAGSAPRSSGDVCLTTELAAELDVEVGDALALFVAGAPADAFQVDGRVACIYDSSRFGLFRTSQLLMDLTDLRAILDRPEASSQLLVTLADGEDPGVVAATIDALADGAVRVEQASETADLIYVIQTAQRAVMWGLVAVTALICAVIIGNIVAFALRRERRELATLRAMGFSPGQLRTVSMLQTLSSGALMVGLGAAVSLGTVGVVRLVGIPIGDGARLFGDDRLMPSLSVLDVGLTAALMLGALAVADLLASGGLLRRGPLEMVRSRS